MIHETAPEARAHATWCSQIVEASAGLSFLLSFLLGNHSTSCPPHVCPPKDANGGRSLSTGCMACSTLWLQPWKIGPWLPGHH